MTVYTAIHVGSGFHTPRWVAECKLWLGGPDCAVPVASSAIIGCNLFWGTFKAPSTETLLPYCSFCSNFVDIVFQLSKTPENEVFSRLSKHHTWGLGVLFHFENWANYMIINNNGLDLITLYFSCRNSKRFTQDLLFNLQPSGYCMTHFTFWVTAIPCDWTRCRTGSRLCQVMGNNRGGLLLCCFY